MLKLISNSLYPSKVFFTSIFIFVLAWSSQAQMKDVDNTLLLNLLDNKVPIIDIREDTEWKETGIIEGSHLITFFDGDGKYDLPSWMKSLGQIARNEDAVILICRSGRRSAIVGKFLVDKAKYREVYNVKDGIKGWIKAELEVIRY